MLKLAAASPRRTAIVLITVLLTVAGSMALLKPSSALTGPTPSAPVAISFTTPTTNLSTGDNVTFHANVTGGVTSNVAGHICKTPAGGPISNNGDFGFAGVYCVKSPVFSGALGSGSADSYEKSVSQANVATSTDVTLKAGTGTVNWLNDDGIPLSLTCDATNPCDLVIEVQINVAPFTTYFTQPLTYAAPPAVPGAPTNVAAIAGDAQALVSWDRLTTANPAVDQYKVVVTPTSPAGPALADIIVPQPGSGTSVSTVVSPLTNGTTYSVQVFAHNSLGYGAAGGPATAAPVALQRFIFQDITVTRPEGALVLTQACATANPYPDEPTSGPAGDVSDVVYGTHCAVPLGTATLVKTGAGAGQYFEASGALNEVTIVDTRDTDDGWTVNGVLTGDGDFHSGATNKFSGKNLGWTPAAPVVTPAIAANDTDPGYTQVATAGGAQAPVSAGLKSARLLGSAANGQGLGIAKLNAQLRVLIPIFAKAGTYQATLQITAI